MDMVLIIRWAAFVGSWFLVAGPLFQAALELSEEQVDRAGIERARTDAVTPRISPWWWLLPPVAYVKHRRRANAERKAAFALLAVEQRTSLVGFLNKAHGWFAVAFGAFLIAVKETGELVEHYHLPEWVWLATIVVVLVGVVVNTAVRMSRRDRAIAGEL